MVSKAFRRSAEGPFSAPPRPVAQRNSADDHTEHTTHELIIADAEGLSTTAGIAITRRASLRGHAAIAGGLHVS